MSNKYHPLVPCDDSIFKHNTIIFINGKLYYIYRVSKLYIFVVPYMVSSIVKYNNDIVFYTIGHNIAFITFDNIKEEDNKERLLISKVNNFKMFDINDKDIFNKCLVSKRDNKFNINFSHFIPKEEIKTEIKKALVNRDFINIFQCHQHHQTTINHEPNSTYYLDILERYKKDFLYNYITICRHNIDEINNFINETPYNIDFKIMFINDLIKLYYFITPSSASQIQTLLISSSC